MSLLRPSGGHRAPSTRPAPGDGARTVGGYCHGPASQAQPVPCPGEPCCVLLPPSGPAQPGQGTRGQGMGPAPGALSSLCGGGGWTWLCTNTPRDSPSLPVPCHQAPQAGPRGTAALEECRGLGRVPGEVKPGTGVGCSPAGSQPSPGTGQSSGTAPSPRAGPGARKYRQGQRPPLLLRSESCSGGDPPPRGVAMGAGGEK